MSLLEIEVGDASVSAVVGGEGARATWSGALEELWRAAEGAARAALAEHGATPTECTVVDLSDTVAVWDQQTLRAACAPVFGAESFADRVHALRQTDPHLWGHLDEGRYAIGSLGGYLVARMTRGVWHVICAPAAERMGLAALTDVPARALPSVLPVGTELGRTDPSFAGLDVAVTL